MQNILSRSDLTKPTSLPRLPSTESRSTPVNNPQDTNRRTGTVKSFSTPFKLNSKSGNQAKEQNPKHKLKRPLFACVPFGKRLKRSDAEEKITSVVSQS